MQDTLSKWTTENPDGTFNVYGVYGECVEKNVSRQRAIALSRFLDRDGDRFTLAQEVRRLPR